MHQPTALGDSLHPVHLDPLALGSLQLPFRIFTATPLHFFNLCIARDFALFDLRASDAYATLHISGALLYDSFSSDDFCWDRPQRVLAYSDDSIDNFVEAHVSQLHSISKDGRLKELVILSGPLKLFAEQYPWYVRRSGDEAEQRDGELVYPNHILPHLFLGGHICTSNLEVLKKAGITRVLNLTPDTPCCFPNELHYLRINIVDSDSQNLGPILTQCFEFIDASRNDGTRVLVHCSEGKSRSTSVVIAYLMTCYRWSFASALSHTRELREICRPNAGFTRQLQLLERSLQNAREF